MSMLRALALMGSGAEGFIKGQRDEEAAQRARDAATFEQKQRAFTMAEQARMLQQRAEMAAAAAGDAPAGAATAQPVTPPAQQPVPADAGSSPSMASAAQAFPVGNPGAAPQPVGQGAPVAAPVAFAPGRPSMSGAVGGQPSAPGAGAQGDAEDAALQRQIGVLRRYDPAAAVKMQMDAQNLRQTKIANAAKDFDDGLNTAAAQGWEALTAFTNASGAHPAQTKFVPEADGKNGQVMFVLPDGTLKPTGRFYENSAKGAMSAAADLAQGTPIQAKVAHALAAQAEARKAKADEAKDARERQHYDVLDRYYQGLLDVKAEKNDIDASKVAGKSASAIAKMPEEDKLQFTDLNKQLELINSERVKAQAAGMWQPDSPGAKAIQKQEATLLMKRDALLSKYGGAAEAPDPLGIRKSGSGTGGETTTTRPATKMEAIARDMAKTGVKDAQIKVSDGNAPIDPTEREPAAAAPAPAPPPAPAAKKPEPFKADPDMEARVKREQAEMSDQKVNRMRYSPEVADYLKRKQDAEEASAVAANATRSKADFDKAQARRRAMGY